MKTAWRQAMSAGGHLENGGQPRSADPVRRGWWQSEKIVRHVNKMICGRPVAGIAEGDIARLSEANEGRPYPLAVSVGCGDGHKEIALLRRGVVDQFHLYERSEARAEIAHAEAVRHGVDHRVRIVKAARYFSYPDVRYDLVFWSGALRRLPDVGQALRWSHSALSPGGVLLINDYVGPNRHQWGEAERAAIRQARGSLPPRFLQTPGGGRRPVALDPHSIERWLAMDADEAADSETILPSMSGLFPDARVRHLGGVIYFAGLSDILGNFDDDRDGMALDALLLADEVLAAAGHSYYASILARRA